MIALALKALGLMRVSEHEAALDKQDEHNFLAWQKAADERDKFRDEVRDTCRRAENAEARALAFEKQVLDLGDELNVAKSSTSTAVREATRLQAIIDTQGLALAGYREQVAELVPDAQKWRDYLKRSRDRKAGKK